MAIIEFAEWLQDELDRRGWRQADLARYGSIATSMLSRVMTGERSPGTDTCVSIARAFKVPPEDVFRRAGLLPPKSEPAPGQQELNFLYDQLAEQDRQNILIYARALVRERGEPYGKRAQNLPKT